MKSFKQLREETQLDEISMDLRQRAARKAIEKMAAIRSKYPAYTGNGIQPISAVPGITKSDEDKWVKKNKQFSIFKGYDKPRVPRTQAARDDANRRALYGGDPKKNPGGLGS